LDRLNLRNVPSSPVKLKRRSSGLGGSFGASNVEKLMSLCSPYSDTYSYRAATAAPGTPFRFSPTKPPVPETAQPVVQQQMPLVTV
jgi:hypothetical protein